MLDSQCHEEKASVKKNTKQCLGTCTPIKPCFVNVYSDNCLFFPPSFPICLMTIRSQHLGQVERKHANSMHWLYTLANVVFDWHFKLCLPQLVRKEDQNDSAVELLDETPDSSVSKVFSDWWYIHLFC